MGRTALWQVSIKYPGDHPTGKRLSDEAKQRGLSESAFVRSLIEERLDFLDAGYDIGDPNLPDLVGWIAKYSPNFSDPKVLVALRMVSILSQQELVVLTEYLQKTWPEAFRSVDSITASGAVHPTLPPRGNRSRAVNRGV